jgi:CheY-like chemotaxis protein
MLASVSPADHGYDLAQVDISAYLTKPVRQSQLYNCLAGVRASAPGAPSLSPSAPNGEPSAAESGHPRETFAGRVLVAEDNIVNQKVAVRMIEKCGYRVDVAANGIEAINTLQLMPYDVVFLDCQMPEMDGYEAAREIRRLEALDPDRRRLPIIAMTANALTGDDEKCFAAGMDDYLSKPVKPQQVKAILEKWMEEKVTTAHLGAAE